MRGGTPMTDSSGVYCDYLDKEMTIMGLLSAFSVVILAAAMDRVASTKPGDNNLFACVWQHDGILILAGSLAFLLATLAFYLQRSLLARYYGELRFHQTPARYDGRSEVDILREADSWLTWAPYQSGFALMPLGFVLYGAALFAPKLSIVAQRYTVGISGGLTLAFIVVNRLVKRAADESGTDHPWMTHFFHLPPPSKRKRKT
jgi:hypothetical protein